MLRPCYHHPSLPAVYPAGDPIFCSMRCAAEDGGALRSDTTPLEISLNWCPTCNQWNDHVIDGCERCDFTKRCEACDEVYTPSQGCPHHPPLPRLPAIRALRFQLQGNGRVVQIMPDAKVWPFGGGQPILARQVAVGDPAFVTVKRSACKGIRLVGGFNDFAVIRAIRIEENTR